MYRHPLAIGILAVVAEDKARRISQSTQAALAGAQARGTLLGSARPGHWGGREQARLRGLAQGRQRSAAVRAEQAAQAVADLLPEIQQQRQQGRSLAAIAQALNDAGQRTVRSKPWTAMQVKRILDRAQVQVQPTPAAAAAV